jgi:hypothetical protein
MTLSDSRQCRRLQATLRPLPSHSTGLPRLLESPFRRAAPTTPADRAGAHVDCFPASRGLPLLAGGSASALSLSRPAQASLTLRPAGSLSHPKATFVTRLQPVQLPTRAARQLPDQSTTLRVDSSSTDDSRLRGALPISDITHHYLMQLSQTPDDPITLSLHATSQSRLHLASFDGHLHEDMHSRTFAVQALQFWVNLILH